MYYFTIFYGPTVQNSTKQNPLKYKLDVPFKERDSAICFMRGFNSSLKSDNSQGGVFAEDVTMSDNQYQQRGSVFYFFFKRFMYLHNVTRYFFKTTDEYGEWVPDATDKQLLNIRRLPKVQS